MLNIITHQGNAFMKLQSRQANLWCHDTDGRLLVLGREGLVGVSAGDRMSCLGRCASYVDKCVCQNSSDCTRSCQSLSLCVNNATIKRENLLVLHLINK